MQANSVFEGIPGTTVTFTAAGNTNYDLSDITGLVLKDDNNQRAKSIYVSVETNALRAAFTADTTQALGHIKAAASSFQIPSEMFGKVSFANAAEGANFTLQVTPFFQSVPVIA